MNFHMPAFHLPSFVYWIGWGMIGLLVAGVILLIILKIRNKRMYG